MKRWALAAVLGMMGAVSGEAAAPSSAECAYCPTYKCWGRCSRACACVTVGNGPGQCVSVEAVPGYLEHGWEELP